MVDSPKMYPICCPRCHTKGTSIHPNEDPHYTFCPDCDDEVDLAGCIPMCRLNHPDDPLEACHACDGHDVYAWEHLSCEVYAITCAECHQPGLSRYEPYADEEKSICDPCQAWFDDADGMDVREAGGYY